MVSGMDQLPIKNDVKQEKEQRANLSRILRALETIATAFTSGSEYGYRFTATGVNNQFTLTPTARLGTTVNNIKVFVAGGIQDPATNYTFASGIVTVAGATIPAGVPVDIWWPV